MTSLRQRMIQDLRIRNYSPKTIDTYICRFAKHFDKSPHLLGTEEIREYQVFLVQRKKASWAIFNQTVCALRFLYQVTLRRKEVVEHIPYPRPERKLPVVLSPKELGRLFGAVGNLKHRTVLETMYAAGLRISEALNLRLVDVDSDRMVLRIRQGKGRKDRYAPLSPTLLESLRAYWTGLPTDLEHGAQVCHSQMGFESAGSKLHLEVYRSCLAPWHGKPPWFPARMGVTYVP